MIRRNTVLLATALSLATFTLSAAPAETTSPAPSNDAARIAGPEGESYEPTRAIIRDEKTGSTRKPTPAETAELVRSLKTLTSRSTANLQVSSTTGGMEMMDLEGRFAMVMVTRPTDEGGNEILCVSSFEQAAEFLGLKLEPKADGQPRKGVANAN